MYVSTSAVASAFREYNPYIPGGTSGEDNSSNPGGSSVEPSYLAVDTIFPYFDNAGKPFSSDAKDKYNALIEQLRVSGVLQSVDVASRNLIGDAFLTLPIFNDLSLNKVNLIDTRTMSRTSTGDVNSRVFTTVWGPTSSRTASTGFETLGTASNIAEVVMDTPAFPGETCSWVNQNSFAFVFTVLDTACGLTAHFGTFEVKSPDAGMTSQAIFNQTPPSFKVGGIITLPLPGDITTLTPGIYVAWFNKEPALVKSGSSYTNSKYTASSSTDVPGFRCTASWLRLPFDADSADAAETLASQTFDLDPTYGFDNIRYFDIETINTESKMTKALDKFPVKIFTYVKNPIQFSGTNPPLPAGSTISYAAFSALTKNNVSYTGQFAPMKPADVTTSLHLRDVLKSSSLRIVTQYLTNFKNADLVKSIAADYRNWQRMYGTLTGYEYYTLPTFSLAFSNYYYKSYGNQLAAPNAYDPPTDPVTFFKNIKVGPPFFAPKDKTKAPIMNTPFPVVIDTYIYENTVQNAFFDSDLMYKNYGELRGTCPKYFDDTYKKDLHLASTTTNRLVFFSQRTPSTLSSSKANINKITTFTQGRIAGYGAMSGFTNAIDVANFSYKLLALYNSLGVDLVALSS